ncbi:WhiB family transcriptional regulator [Micromonospora chersina]|uniref:WhiB family transcriptional regulator n=1 Tax=Micromonospora chersina TaxID=47854 RepID=UPI00371D3F5F
MRHFESVLDDWPSWVDAASSSPACRGQELELFFPSGSEKSRTTCRQVQQAKAICSSCPLLETCREWALRQPARRLHGIWGGTTPSERRQLLKGQAARDSQNAALPLE